MRLFFISLAIALLCLLPETAEIRGWDLPDIARSILRIPAVGLTYMTVFFHELGHTVTFWSYGQAAVPVFNLTDGGGFAQPIGSRSYILQGLVYFCWCGAIIWLFRDGALRLAVVLLAVLVLHACFTTGEHFMLPVNYFGNGGAVLVGCFCIWRAALNKTVVEENAEAERYMHMIFGLFAVLNEGLGLSFELMTDLVARAQYNAGIGDSHIANDFTVLADRLETSIQHVGAFHFAMTSLALLVTGILIWFGRQEQRAEEAEAQANAGIPMVRRQLRK